MKDIRETLIGILKKEVIDDMDRIHFSSQIFGFAFFIDSFETPEAWEYQRDEVFDALRMSSEMIDRIWYLYQREKTRNQKMNYVVSMYDRREKQLEDEIEKLSSELEFIKEEA